MDPILSDRASQHIEETYRVRARNFGDCEKVGRMDTTFRSLKVKFTTLDINMRVIISFHLQPESRATEQNSQSNSIFSGENRPFFRSFFGSWMFVSQKSRVFRAQKSTGTKNHRRSVDKTLGKVEGHQCASNGTRHIGEPIQGAP